MVRDYIIFLVVMFASFAIGFVFGKIIFKNKPKYDGTITIDEADELGHAGMNLEFGIEYEELMKRNSMTFQVKNHMKTES